MRQRGLDTVSNQKLEVGGPRNEAGFLVRV